MKRITSIASMVGLLGLISCKHKEEAPAPAASASTVAVPASAAATPSVGSEAGPAGEFEGEIVLVAKGKFAGNEATPVSLTLLIKNNRVRIDVPESLTAARGLGPASLLILPADKKAYAILDARKQAVLLELDKLAEQGKAYGVHSRPKVAATAPTPPRPQKTGKFETVAGIQCEIWHFNQGKTEADACIAEQETSWFHLPEGGTPAELSWLTPIADGKHFPLRVVATEQQLERGRIEVTQLQHKPLPASQFELPADYAVLSLEQMIGSMLGGLGGPGLQLPPGLKLPPAGKLPAAAKSPSSK